MFRSADTTRRIPPYLQPHTKENLIWQLKLSGVLIGVILIKGRYDQWKLKQKYTNL